MKAQQLPEGTPSILFGDLNDAPNHSFYSPNSDRLTAAYAELTKAGWIDSAPGGNSVPTTYTLNRCFPIDYIMFKAQSRFECKLDEVQQFQLVGYDEHSQKVLVAPGSKDAVFGPPLRALGGQPAIPSDHVPITATVFLSRHVPL